MISATDVLEAEKNSKHGEFLYEYLNTATQVTSSGDFKEASGDEGKSRLWLHSEGEATHGTEGQGASPRVLTSKGSMQIISMDGVQAHT